MTELTLEKGKWYHNEIQRLKEDIDTLNKAIQYYSNKEENAIMEIGCVCGGKFGFNKHELQRLLEYKKNELAQCIKDFEEL